MAVLWSPYKHMVDKPNVKYVVNIHGLVAVHVGDVLDVGLAHHVLVRLPRHHHHPQLPTLQGGNIMISFGFGHER